MSKYGQSLHFNTQVYQDGKIAMKVHMDNCGSLAPLSAWMLDTREASIKEALIELGWTPPKIGTSDEKRG